MFADGGHHGGDQDEEPHREAVGHQRGREPAEGLGDHDELVAPPHVGHDGVGVLDEAGGVVVRREVGGDHLVPGSLQLGHHEVPVPRI